MGELERFQKKGDLTRKKWRKNRGKDVILKKEVRIQV